MHVKRHPMMRPSFDTPGARDKVGELMVATFPEGTAIVGIEAARMPVVMSSHMTREDVANLRDALNNALALWDTPREAWDTLTPVLARLDAEDAS
jgi:hypothetical protein